MCCGERVPFQDFEMFGLLLFFRRSVRMTSPLALTGVNVVSIHVLKRECFPRHDERCDLLTLEIEDCINCMTSFKITRLNFVLPFDQTNLA